MSAVTKPLNAKIWARDPDDWYVEDSWCSARLFEQEEFEWHVIDPACGLGRIVASARSAGLPALGTDKILRSEFCERVIDFLSPRFREHYKYPHHIVSNPPFGIADAFVRAALDRASGKVAMLLPATWHCGDKRSRWLETTPLQKILYLTPRPSMPPGAVIQAGVKPGGGKKDFAWYIWLKGYEGEPESGWLHRDARS